MSESTNTAKAVRLLTKEDLPGVVEVHVRAFPTAATTRLGRGAVLRYYQWQLLGPHDVVALGAFRDGQLAGFCFAGVFRGALSGYLRKNRAFLASRLLLRPWLIGSDLFRDRLRLAARSLLGRQPAPASGPAPAPFGVLSIATDPDLHGGGVGRLLMAETERIARERGVPEMGLSVHPSNHQAIRFYEGLGWIRVPPGQGWEGKMRKRLDATGDGAAPGLGGR
jgi:ribosomal protein S18 acetylase RimI-like enzyme